jgi:hypothetical protein
MNNLNSLLASILATLAIGCASKQSPAPIDSSPPPPAATTSLPPVNLALTPNGIVLFDISPETMNRIARENHLPPLKDWADPRLTGLPVQSLPRIIEERFADQPGAVHAYRVQVCIIEHRKWTLYYNESMKALVIIEEPYTRQKSR